MCSRYHLKQEHYRKVLDQLGIPAPATFLTRYNIAPNRDIPAIRSTPRSCEAATLRWGLTPAWARADDPASRLVNARAETLAEKPSFREALASRRCLVPATGFYEWESLGRAKQPWYFRWRDEARPILFAGLWERWRGPSGDPIESCALITTEPNDVMRPIHHRMPAMLSTEHVAPWLDSAITDPSLLGAFLRPAAAAEMIATRLDDYVSNVQHEGPECLAPAKGPAASQLSLF